MSLSVSLSVITLCETSASVSLLSLCLVLSPSVSMGWRQHIKGTRNGCSAKETGRGSLEMLEAPMDY